MTSEVKIEALSAILRHPILSKPSTNTGPEAFERLPTLAVVDADSVRSNITLCATLLFDDVIPFLDDVCIKEVGKGLEGSINGLLEIQRG